MNSITFSSHSHSLDPLAEGGERASGMERGRHLERLVTLSAPAIEDLYRQLDSPTITVLLADSQGGVLRAIGNGRDISALPAVPCGDASRAQPAMPNPQHAMTPPRLPAQRVGIAVPILPPDGGLLGFVDAEASPLDWLSHANALLQTAARIIEHRLIESDQQGFLLLRFHRYPTVLGTPLEALALFDASGGVLLANRVAIDLLAPCPLGCGVPAASCFATQWCGIVGYAALGMRESFTLRDHRGANYSARASLRRAVA
jgi:hypothetical protein